MVHNNKEIVWRRDYFEEWKESFPYEDHTFLVEQSFAKPLYMNQFRADVSKWSTIAEKVFIGTWCARYEMLWKDVPVYVYKSDPTIKIGYCRTQSDRHPDRELWLISLKSGTTFVVDKVCITDEFLRRMGRDTNKWMSICWCHLQHEVVWEELQTGTLDGGYVRDADCSLDSPFIPSSISDIEERVTKYELENM
ncbi:MAG: hypothetical protein HPY85_13125 [Anaerolineae bacterium]|nr:hypothetical protein [Anaerolineae bacterium]